MGRKSRTKWAWRVAQFLDGIKPKWVFKKPQPIVDSKS